MTKDEAVLEFVNLARTHIYDDYIDSNIEYHIKKSFDSIVDAVIVTYRKEVLPKLIICNTYNKYSTVLPIRSSKDKCDYYLLYDKHLNDLNDLLNSFFLSDQDIGHDIWKFAYELFMEEAMISKDDVMITYYGLNKAALGPYNVSAKKDEEIIFISNIQEKYIIAHEVGHWLFEMLKQKENEKLINISNIEVVLEDIREILCEVYEQYEGMFQDKDYRCLIEEQNTLVHNNSRIVEECFADAVAYSFIFDFIKKEYGNKLEIKLHAGKALFLVMLNLQLLAMHHMTISEESFENATSIRLAFFRNYIGIYFEDKQKDFNEMLEQTVIIYENKITNLILECFSELEDRKYNIYDELENREYKIM